MSDIFHPARRTVVGAAAWAAPAVAVAIAAPLAAASGEVLCITAPCAVLPCQRYDPVTIVVTGAAGANAVVTLVIASGDATLCPPSVTTDANGRATVSGILAGRSASILRATLAAKPSVTAVVPLDVRSPTHGGTRPRPGRR